jgi:hypothetical protein
VELLFKTEQKILVILGDPLTAGILGACIFPTITPKKVKCADLPSISKHQHACDVLSVYDALDLISSTTNKKAPSVLVHFYNPKCLGG